MQSPDIFAFVFVLMSKISFCRLIKIIIKAKQKIEQENESSDQAQKIIQSQENVTIIYFGPKFAMEWKVCRQVPNKQMPSSVGDSLPRCRYNEVKSRSICFAVSHTLHSGLMTLPHTSFISLNFPLAVPGCGTSIPIKFLVQDSNKAFNCSLGLLQCWGRFGVIG